MPTTLSQQRPQHYHSNTHKSSPLSAYHSEVMQAMCSQMVHHRRRPDMDKPLPLARKPSGQTVPTISRKTSGTVPTMSRKPSSSAVPTVSTSRHNHAISQHVQEEMARRQKADRVLQDLSSDKSRQQARARETARRNKWAKSIANACPPTEVPTVKKQLAMGYQPRRKNPQIIVN